MNSLHMEWLFVLLGGRAATGIIYSLMAESTMRP